jgi:hypothetical protein
MFYVGKGPEYRPFRDFRPVPSAYGPRAQISNHGRAHALLLYKVARGQRIDIYRILTSSGYLKELIVRYGDR